MNDFNDASVSATESSTENINTLIDENVSSDLTENNEKTNGIKSFFGWIDDLVLYFSIFILVMSFIFRPVVVNGNSMKNTLYNGDVLVLNGLFYEPKHGDIIVISRENQPDRPLIKRVIAVGGDTIDIDYETYTVYVNGVALKEDYAYIDSFRGFGEKTDTTKYPVTVPEGYVFVMGDNRGDSTDSREVGAIENGQILGKVLFRIYRQNPDEGDLFFGPVK